MSDSTEIRVTMNHAADSDGAFPVRRAAILAGAGYVLLFALAIFANFLVREGLIVAGDAAATAANIAASEGLFRVGMVSFLIIFLIDVFVAWGLYILFRGVNRDLSLLTAWFRIVYTVFLGVALVFFFQALQLLSGADFLSGVETDVINATALVALDSFNSTWLIGLTAFGVHVILIGYLILRYGIAPKLLGIILVAAGAAYCADTIAHTVLANYADYAGLFTAIVALPAVIAEGWFGIWLLVKGGK